MTRDEFLAYVTEGRQRHPIWFDLPSDDTADELRLAEIEASLRARLPNDYRWFLQEFGGGDFAFASIYSADAGSNLGLPVNQPTGIEPHVVAFSDDGAGNWFVFPVEQGSCEDRVLLLDHETGEVRSTVYVSFLEFVARVALRVADS